MGNGVKVSFPDVLKFRLKVRLDCDGNSLSTLSGEDDHCA